MEEIKLIDRINATRIMAMKLKYFALVQAYKKAYSENPTQADVEKFVSAAINLASDDVCDIIFPYSVVEEDKTIRYKESLEDDTPYLDGDFYEISKEFLNDM